MKNLQLFFLNLYMTNIQNQFEKSKCFYNKKLKNVKKYLEIMRTVQTVVFPLNPFHSFLTIQILYNILLNKLIIK